MPARPAMRNLCRIGDAGETGSSRRHNKKAPLLAAEGLGYGSVLEVDRASIHGDTL